MAGTAIAIPSFLNPVVYLVAELFQMLCGLTKSVQSFIFGHSVEAAEPNVEFICNIDGTQGRDDGNPSSIVKENLLTKLQNDISFALKINQNLISQNIQLEEKMTYCIKSDCSTKLKTNSTFCYFWIGYGAPDTPYDFGSEILNSDSNLSSCSVLTCDLKANSTKNQYLNSLRSSTMDPAIDKNLINTCSRIRYLSECSDDSFICFGGDTSDDDNDIVNMNPEGTQSDITFESEKEDHEDIENHKTSKKKKKVNFNLTPKIRVMRTWDFAYRKARKGEWELYARDRARFQHRIERTALIIDPVLSPDHRSKIFNDRFTA